MHIPQLYALLLQHSTVQTSGLGWSLHSIYLSVCWFCSIYPKKSECWSWSSQIAGFVFQMLIWPEIDLKIECKDHPSPLVWTVECWSNNAYNWGICIIAVYNSFDISFSLVITYYVNMILNKPGAGEFFKTHPSQELFKITTHKVAFRAFPSRGTWYRYATSSSICRWRRKPCLDHRYLGTSQHLDLRAGYDPPHFVLRSSSEFTRLIETWGDKIVYSPKSPTTIITASFIHSDCDN